MKENLLSFCCDDFLRKSLYNLEREFENSDVIFDKFLYYIYINKKPIRISKLERDIVF